MLPARRSVRLPTHDYHHAAAYFVTICLQTRRCLFCDIAGGVMALNEAGRAIERILRDTPRDFPGVGLDAFVVMPDHVHAVIVIGSVERATTRVAPTLGRIVGAFKSRSTVEYVRGVATAGWPRFEGRLWQRGYYDHVIRDDEDFGRVRRYIAENPARWQTAP